MESVEDSSQLTGDAESIGRLARSLFPLLFASRFLAGDSLSLPSSGEDLLFLFEKKDFH